WRVKPISGNPSIETESVEAVRAVGKGAGFDRAYIGFERCLDAAGLGQEILDELGPPAAADAQQIVHDQYLAIGVMPGANADNRHIDTFGNPLAEVSGNAFEQEGIRASASQGLRVPQQGLGM